MIISSLHSNTLRSKEHFKLLVAPSLPGSDNQEVLSRLRACLQTFEGSRAFHNYTKRRLYRLPAKPSKSSGEPDSGTHQAAAPAPFAASSQEAAGQAAAGERAQRTTSKPQKHERRFSASTDGEGRGAGHQTGTLPQADSSAGDLLSDAAIDDDDDGTAAAAGEDADAVDLWPQRRLQFRSSICFPPGDEARAPLKRAAVKPDTGQVYSYQDDWGPGDKLGSAHYRIVGEASASDVLQLTPGGTPCVRMTFCANSFVLHQIRHMVAVAAAAAIGSVPLEFVDASLSPCCRTITPISPPQTLVLVDAMNSRYPMSEDRLELQENGRLAQEHFYEQTVQPALSAMLESSEWGQWRSELSRIQYDGEAMKLLLSQHAAWKASKPGRKPPAEQEIKP